MMDSDFIDDFIEEYKNQPCLWQASSIDFKNRKKRQEAYYKLMEVASLHGEHYNIERTKQKINNLRCAFRQQLKKFTESKNKRSGKEDAYCPKRRYFESLMFLMSEERPEKIKNELNKDIIMEKETMEECNKEYTTETYTTLQEPEDSSKETMEVLPIEETEVSTEVNQIKSNRVQIDVQCDEEVNLLWPRISQTPKPTETVLHIAPTVNHVESITTNARPRTMSVSSHTSSHTEMNENAQKKIKIDCSATNFEKLLTLACSKINSSERQEDDFSIFGKMVAYKLRSMDTQQSIVAEKLITDILLEGQMKLLSYPNTRTVPAYRQEGQAFVISNLNLNGTTEQQTDRPQYSTQTIQYTTGNGSQL